MQRLHTRSIYEKLVEERTITLEKNANGELGISIIGGLPGKKPVTVNRIIKDSSASLSQQVKANDILMKVNGEPVWNKTRKQVVDEFKNSEKRVTLCLVQLEQRNKEEESTIGEEEAKWTTLEGIDLTFSFSSAYQSGTNGDISDGFEVQTKEGVFNFLCSTASKQWVEAITETCRVLSTRKVQMLSMTSDPVGQEMKANVKMAGAVQECLPSNTHTSIWQQKVLVLSGCELQIFQYWPEAVCEWIHPEVKYKILEISYRKVYKPRENCIALYWGKGVNHLISFATDRERHRWIKKLNSVLCAAARDIKSQSFLGKWRGREISLTVDIECGFSLRDNSGGQEMPKLLWKEEFQNLLSTSDDGSSQLKLSFTDSSNIIIQLQDMHTALCVMQNLYLAKMSSVN